jgi:hypothetical protein
MPLEEIVSKGIMACIGNCLRVQCCFDYAKYCIQCQLLFEKLHNARTIYFLAHIVANKGQTGCLDIIEH